MGQCKGLTYVCENTNKETGGTPGSQGGGRGMCVCVVEVVGLQVGVEQSRGDGV